MAFELELRSYTPEADCACVEVPFGTSAIAAGAFSGVEGVESVVLPATVKTIGERAFEKCRDLTSIALPDSLEELGAHAFQSCKKLRSVALPTGWKALPDSCFELCGALEHVEGTQGLRQVGSRAFVGCKELVAFRAPELELVGAMAFNGCRKLGELELGDALRRIGDNAFRCCEGIAGLDLPDSVEGLGRDLFVGCGKLRIGASEELVRRFPDAFPRALSDAAGVRRFQDRLEYEALWRAEHAEQIEELKAELASVKLRLHACEEARAALGMFDFDERERLDREREELEADLGFFERYLNETEHPSWDVLSQVGG